MSKKNQRKLFKMFSVLEETRHMNQTGCGLGLTICKNIIEKLRGDIYVESEEGRGTSIMFSIPVQLEKSANRTTEEGCQFRLRAIPERPTHALAEHQ